MDTVKAATNRTEAMLVLYEATYTQHFFVLFCAAICIQPKQPRKGRRRCWFCRRLPKHFLLCFAQQYGYSQSSHEKDGGDAGFVGGYLNSTFFVLFCAAIWIQPKQPRKGRRRCWFCRRLLHVMVGCQGSRQGWCVLVCVGVGVYEFVLVCF